jgi:hypothetical protein
MARQVWQDGPYVDPPITSPLSADVATTITPMWTGLSFTPIYANDAKAGKIYVVEAGGILTTATTGTLTITPNHGANSIAMGASVAQTVPGTALTAVPWFLRFVIVYRTIGAAGLNSTCIGEGLFHTASVAGTAGAGPIGLTFGGTSATVDATINNSITISKTLTVAGSFTTHWAYIHAVN